MSDVTPTRNAALEMKDERRAMHEGYVFLDEKCLLLAGEILRELSRYTALRAALDGAHAEAARALQAAVGRHGLDGLQVYPSAVLDEGSIRSTARILMGVHLQDAVWQAPHESHAAPTSVRSPEAEACREAFQALLPHAVSLAAVTGNLERLYLEYRRAVRRARALQDVLLPELDRAIYNIEARLDELEQEDAIWMRQAV
jgi:V/A-type H+-transporting ATPase subunit D